MAVLNKDAISADAYTTSNEKAFWNYINKENATLAEFGISAAFKPYSAISRTFDCYPLPTNSALQDWHRALKLRSRPSILREIDVLSDRQYEALGAYVLESIGADKVSVTPHGGEGGVDFYASIGRVDSNLLIGSVTSPIRVVGQSKRYSEALQSGAFKEFLTTLEEVRHMSQPKTTAHIPTWFKAARGPIVGMVFAHNGFQSGADSRARSHGVIVADSLHLAEVIALSCRLSGSVANFNKQEFHARIEALLI
jgi:hypothetical protein